MVELERSLLVGDCVVVAKVLVKAECLPLLWKHSQVFAVAVVPRHSQVSEVVSEVEAMY